MTRNEIFRIIDSVLEAHGLTRSKFVELGEKGWLEDPDLRDLWLIWGLGVADEVKKATTVTH